MDRAPFALLCLLPALTAAQETPLRLGIAGLVHGHVTGFLNRSVARNDFRIVGIAEPDRALARRYAERYKIDPAILYSTVEEMLEKARPEAVAAFTNTFDHAAVVETCAARGVHVMMEKPLAVSMEHANRIVSAARKSGIHVLVNYETTWYASNRAAGDLVRKGSIGDIRRIVVQDGHQGPKEIGVPPEFFAWLTDPKLNGAGALFDFGCYGADLMTWLMEGQRPLSVTAVTKRIKPDIYPKVDDDATVLVEYPNAIGVIEASWNWPFNRKDMEVYGRDGYVVTVGGDRMRVRLGGRQEEQVTPVPIPDREADPITYLAAVVRGSIKPEGLSSLRVNLIATEILDAARRSAQTGQTVRLRR